MLITEKNNIFKLDGANVSYIFGVFDGKYPCHLYWGAKLPVGADPSWIVTERARGRASFHTPLANLPHYADDIPSEFAWFGAGDHRTPSFHALYANGSTVADFSFGGYEIKKGKPKLTGLPASYCEGADECETLEIAMVDKLTGLRAVLSYSVFAEYDIIARSVRYENAGAEAIDILHAGSLCMDVHGVDYNILHGYGDHARERALEQVPVSRGVYVLDSKRGNSSHMNNPFAVLMRDGAGEYNGDVYGLSLVYSGNFNITIEGDITGTTRLVAGINPFNFSWRLAPGETFQTPECVLAYSGAGLDGMSNIYHKFYRERLCRGKYKLAPRPLVINNWEATGMRFNAEKIEAIAKAGAELGLDIMVLDDGWFGKRDNDATSLGDWFVDKAKLPDGLEGLIKNINDMGMKFGLWFEPEMISPNSDLYRARPDWCLHAKDRARTEGRRQLMIDMSRADVRDYLFDNISKVLKSGNIEYVKWDCNRNINETLSRDQSHRHILGTYDLMERLITAFPDILWESCSGGGGRFDPGMLYYMPQTWTSDNTSEIDRQRIQYGTSVIYPPSSMTAHIGNINVGFKDGNPQLHFRALVAMGFNFGYELDLSKLSEREMLQARGYAQAYKKIRSLVQYGDFHRLENPFAGHYASWITVAPDKSRAVAFFFQHTHTNAVDERRVKLRGLDENKKYKVGGWGMLDDGKGESDGIVALAEQFKDDRLERGREYYGGELMRVGLRINGGSCKFVVIEEV